MGHSQKYIAPLVLGGIIAAGASLAGNAIGSASQSKTNQTSIDINRENNAFNAAEAEKQRQWQEDMWTKKMLWVKFLICVIKNPFLLKLQHVKNSRMVPE